MAWHEFWTWLSAAGPVYADGPPVPLILAASGEPDATKHSRLRKQLVWADRHGLLDAALSRLAALPAECWNTGSPDSWDAHSYQFE